MQTLMRRAVQYQDFGVTNWQSEQLADLWQFLEELHSRLQDSNPMAGELLDWMVTELDYLSYFQDYYGEGEHSAGVIASLLLESTGVAVGLCYKRRGEGVTNVSVRGATDLDSHLGEITQRLAEKYGGFGGGHSRASGASLPTQNLLNFIRDFDDAL